MAVVENRRITQCCETDALDRLVDLTATETKALNFSPSFRWKGIFDCGVAAILLIPGLPIIGVLILLVRLTSRGPGILRQTRIGKNGRRFTMYKIRTMVHDAEARSGPVWSAENDPRVTAVGRVLRKFHLDEFPQLFNVLKRDMSLVGPRPERPEFAYVLADTIPGYLKRLVVTPGITGLAQLNLPPDSDLSSVQCKLALDCEYCENAGIFMDIRVLLCTLVHFSKLPNFGSPRFFGLQREIHCPGCPADLSSTFSGTCDSMVTPASIPCCGNGDSTKDSDKVGETDEMQNLTETTFQSRPKPR